MKRQIQDDALYNDKEEKKTKRDKDRIIACIVVFGPIVIAIIDRVIRELS